MCLKQRGHIVVYWEVSCITISATNELNNTIGYN